MKRSRGRGGQRAAAAVSDPAEKAHPVRAGGGTALPVDQNQARRGPLILCCSVRNWKSRQKVQNKHRERIYIINTP